MRILFCPGDHAEFIMLSLQYARIYTEANVDSDQDSSEMNLHLLELFAYYRYRKVLCFWLHCIWQSVVWVGVGVCMTLKLCRCQMKIHVLSRIWWNGHLAVLILICWFVCFPLVSSIPLSHPLTLSHTFVITSLFPVLRIYGNAYAKLMRRSYQWNYSMSAWCHQTQQCQALHPSKLNSKYRLRTDSLSCTHPNLCRINTFVYMHSMLEFHQSI